MKKEIKIQIPDNLSKEQEAMLVGKKLYQRALSGSARNEAQTRIGEAITVMDLETIIRVVRVSNEQPIGFCKCPVCSSEYQSNVGEHYFTNYGGKVRKLAVCSSQCVDVMVTNFPGRVAAKKSRLSPIRLF